MSAIQMENLAVQPSRNLPDEHARKPWFGQAAGWLVLALFMVWFIRLFLANPKLKPEIIWKYLFNDRIMEGLWSTLLLAFYSMIGALIVGAVVGFCRISLNPVLRTASWLYVWIFRSTPLVVQVLLWGNLALLIPVLGLGPFTVKTNDVVTPFLAGVVALMLHEASYVAEIVRSGVQSVPRPQREAADALALSWWETQRHIILPQALKVMIPPLGGVFVLLLKSTSLVIVISGGDLLTEAQNIASMNLYTVELLLVATVWFLVVTSVAYAGQHYLEWRFNRQNGTRTGGLDEHG